MANILIKDLTAGTPAVTDLLIFANPTTGLAKKTTITTFNAELTLANLSDVEQGTPPQNSILAWDGSFAYVTDVLRGNGLTQNYIPYFANSNPLSLEDSRMINGTYGVEITETTILNTPSAIFALNSDSKGFLKPRMITTERISITSPVKGLEVFDTTLNLPYYYNGTAWVAVSGGGSAIWGNITGTLSSQTDLQSALNAKQATLVSGTNIKTINGTTILGSGDIVIAAITSLNGLTASTQTFAVASTGTDFTITSTTATHTFAIPTASASARGLLSSANWTTFNNKIGGSGTANYLPKFTAASTIGNSVIYETVSGNVGIGTTLDLYKLDVAGTGRFISQSLTGNSLIFGNAEYQWNFNTSIFKAILSLGIGSSNFLNFGYDTPNSLINIFNAGNVEINTNYFTVGGAANSPITSARFEISSTTKGSLPLPRMTTAQIKAIVSPVNGLMAYSTDDFVPCFYDSGAARWEKLNHSTL